MSALGNLLKRQIDPVPSERKTHTLRNGAILIVLVTVFTVSSVLHLPLLPSGGDTIRAEFSNSSQVFSNNAATPVRVGGVDVGKVEKVEPGRTPQTSMVTMRINTMSGNDDVTVKRDARADIRWRLILGGEMYIDLHPGSPRGPDLGSGVIPARQTSHQQELDDLLQIYNGGTAQAQRGVLKGFGRGFSDPPSAGRSIERVSPALRSVQRGTEPVLGQQPDDVRRLVAATGKTLDTLGRDQASLQGLVTGGNRALRITDARRRQLGAALRLSPSTLDSTLTTMRRLRTTLDHLDPIATRLRPGARALAPAARTLRPTLVETQSFLREARPLLSSAGPTFDHLRTASKAGVPLLQGLDPTLQRLDRELLPYLRTRDDRTRLRVFETVGPTFSVLDHLGSEFDRIGHRSRVTVPLGRNSVSLPGVDLGQVGGVGIGGVTP